MNPTTKDIVSALGFAPQVARLRAGIAAFVDDADPAMQEMLKHQFGPGSKYFRPLTIFACNRAAYGGRMSKRVMRRAVVLELMHNVSLIIDDILDQSPTRRGVETLHCRFGLLPALMASGYIVAEGYRMSAHDPYAVGVFSELLQRLGVAECTQWAWRRQPKGYEDWRFLAQEDTGSMFEACAALATGDESLRHFGRLLGMVYHGCDDVADVKGLTSLGGGGQDDLRDGILTLPASLALEHEGIGDRFCAPKPTKADLRAIAKAMRRQLPEAEIKLDELATSAKWEAQKHAPQRAAVLYALVDHTRELSRR